MVTPCSRGGTKRDHTNEPKTAKRKTIILYILSLRTPAYMCKHLRGHTCVLCARVYAHIGHSYISHNHISHSYISHNYMYAASI